MEKLEFVVAPNGQMIDVTIERKVKKNTESIEALRADLLRLNNKIDALERTIRDVSSKNMELQGKIVTLAGRIRGGER